MLILCQSEYIQVSLFITNYVHNMYMYLFSFFMYHRKVAMYFQCEKDFEFSSFRTSGLKFQKTSFLND